MATMLRDYFQPAGQQRALEAYGKFATGKAWSVPAKMDLYKASRTAFDAAVSDDQRLKSFETIYRELTGSWQVFRPSGATKCWGAPKICETLQREFSQFPWGGPITLLTFLGSAHHDTILDSLLVMEGIKPNKSYPIMAVSKFLHFYNPSLFPIYDGEVIENRVFKRFKTEYREFCKSASFARPTDCYASYFRNYMRWGSSLLSSAGPSFMPAFVKWLHDELPRKKFDALGPEMLGTLYATAFEFTAIGAAYDC